MALDLVDRKRAANVAKGIDCRTPLILAVTDGEATDEDCKNNAKAAIAAAEGTKPPRRSGMGSPSVRMLSASWRKSFAENPFSSAGLVSRRSCRGSANP